MKIKLVPESEFIFFTVKQKYGYIYNRYLYFYRWTLNRMDQVGGQEEKEDQRPPEDQGDNSLVIDEEKPNEGKQLQVLC